jgi:hypothetical protein
VPPGEIEFVAPEPDRGVSGSDGEQKPPGSGLRWLVRGLAVAVAVAVVAVWLGNRPQSAPSAPPVPAAGRSGVPVPATSAAGRALLAPEAIAPVTVTAAATAPAAAAMAAPMLAPAAAPAAAGGGTVAPATGCVATLMKRLFGMADAYRRSRAAGHSAAVAERAARKHLATVLSAGTHRYTRTLRSWLANRATLVRGSGKLDLTRACGRDAAQNAWMQVAAGVAQAGRTG